VDSEATVALITKSFDALKTNPKIERAEALRRAMAALISGGVRTAHASAWAPFVVAGEARIGKMISSHPSFPTSIWFDSHPLQCCTTTLSLRSEN